MLYRPKTLEYRNAHRRLVSARGSASGYACFTQCGREASEWASLGTDHDDLDDYLPLCAWCHRSLDSPAFNKPDRLCGKGLHRLNDNPVPDKSGRPRCRQCRKDREARNRARDKRPSGRSRDTLV